MEQVFTSLTCGGPISVYVKDGRITRIRPLQARPEEYIPWLVNARGKTFSPPKAMKLTPMVHGERSRTYSKDRIPYPMKRADFDPKGSRNPQNRGKSEYIRISWDEASELVASELLRIRETYGHHAVTGITSSHHTWGVVGYKTGPFKRFMNMLDYTPILDNPDSWEGWHWGATHTYGYWWALGLPEQNDLLEDTLQNSDMVIFWSHDPDTTRGIYNGQENQIWRQWIKELGIKTVFIDPYYNYTNAFMDGTWLAPRPGTDTAVALAIAYTWFNDDTYDKDYVNTRTHGIEEFKSYVMGIDDGIPKTPEWAEQESGIPARKLRALAREWAKKRVCLSAGCRGGEGGACRAAYGTEWPRMMVLLQAMQGLGKPGVSIWSGTLGAPARQADLWFPGYAEREGSIATGIAVNKTPDMNKTTQRLYRPTFPDAVLNGETSFYGLGQCGKPQEHQFIESKYPIEGIVKAFYRYGGSFIGTMMDTNKWVKMYQSDKLEFVVNQDIWFSGETRFADVILPACGPLERDDLGEWGSVSGRGPGHTGNNWRVIVRQMKCIEPLHESKSDYEIFRLISRKMGLEELFTEGKDELDWVRLMYESSDLSKKGVMSWEEFNKKGYCIINNEPDKPYKPTPAFRWYAEGRNTDVPSPLMGTDRAACMGTPTGKIEFASETLRNCGLEGEERPIVPQYIPSWEGHRSELIEKYPIQLIIPHPHFSIHTHHDSHVSWLNEINDHRLIKDGHAWWRVRLNPRDAAERGICDTDIVEVYNDRGSVLCAAMVTERVVPGVAHGAGSSARYEPLSPEPGATDKGGCMNLLTSSRFISKYAPGMTNNSCLCQIRKWEG